jgi:hypothetical protein
MKQNQKLKTECFCALCSSKRTLRYSRHLQGRHYLQMVVLVIGISAASFPYFHLKGLFTLPLIWAIFESIHKSLYRRDLKCPYCGFDPTWYKKDINLARRKVEDFLRENPQSPILVRARLAETLEKENTLPVRH